MPLRTTPPDSASSSKARVKPYPFLQDPLPETALSAKETVHRLRDILGAGDHGAEVWGQDDQQYRSSTVVFNGAVRSQAHAVVKPRSAVDVSRTIKFARQHELEVSVKAGGTGVHGWSISGHIILDLSLLTQMAISLPESATTLHDSFQQVQPKGEGHGVLRRTSLASTQGSSSTLNTKRPASDALGDGEDYGADARGKRRPTLGSIEEDEPRSDSRSNQDGDVVMSIVHSGGTSRTGSVDGRGRGSTTPATSISGGDVKPDGEAPSGLSSAGESSQSIRPRMTYVNPSPTTTSAFPFIPSSFGAGASSPTSFLSSFGSNTRLVLNTNPDPPAYTIVTFGAGVRSKQLDSFTANSPHGAFHVPTSAFPVGTGQYLSGGYGFIGRSHGLAMDNVVEAEVVLADGRIVWVGEGGKHLGEWLEGEDPEELWWGIRGAGAILGVVTHFRAKAYYIPSVFAGNFIYLFDKNTTPSLLRHVRDCIKGSPRSLYINIIMTAGPPGAPAIVVMQLCFSGSRSEGETYVQAISSWEGGRCLFQDFSERTFERQQLAVEEVLRGGAGRKWFIKSDMLKSLSDEVIDATCERFHEIPDGCTWLFEFTGGSVMADVKDSVFPTSHREGAFTVAALHKWAHDEPPVEDTRCVTTAEDWINEVIYPNSPGGPLPCFLQSSSQEDVAAVYGENFDRLAKLKRTVDPTNIFKHAMWPPSHSPASREPAQSPTDGQGDSLSTIEGKVVDALEDGPGRAIVEAERKENRKNE